MDVWVDVAIDHFIKGVSLYVAQADNLQKRSIDTS